MTGATNRIAVWLILPALIVGVVMALILVRTTSPPLVQSIERAARADLEMASSMGLRICEENFDRLLDLRLSNDPDMIQALRRDALDRITALGGRFHQIHLAVLGSNGAVVQTSLQNADLTDVPASLDPFASTVKEQSFLGNKAFFHVRYFPFWRWRIVSFISTSKAMAPLALTKKAVYLTIFGVLFALCLTVLGSFHFLVNRPLQSIMAAAHEVSQGRMKTVPVNRRDELGQVTTAFNTMVSSLKEGKQHIEAMMAELQVSEERYRSVVEHTGTATVILEPDKTISLVNREMVRLSGYSKEEIEGRLSWTELVAYAEDLQRMEHYHRQRREIDPGEPPGSYEFTFVDKLGGLKTVVATVGLIPGTLRSVASFLDITDYKKTQQALAEAKQSAEAASRSKGQFLANMSHEIRTPLNGVLGMLQILQETDLDTQQEECVDIGLKASRSLLRVINDVLDLSKIESGKLALAEEAFEPWQIFKEVAGVFQPMAQKKGLALHMWLDPGLPRSLRGDPARMRQVLFNLLGNALKFTDRGEVRLDVCRLGQDESEELIRLLIVVTDTGAGIPEDKLETVFEEFLQAKSPQGGSAKGTGLGLGIVKRLVALMDSNLAVVSEEGRGTAVYWSLPLRLERGRPGRLDPSLSESYAGSHESVLLAEDDPTSQAVAKKILEDLGKRVLCAGNGQEALKRIQEEGVSCVFMDIQMPEVDGLEAIRRIRRMEAVRGVNGQRIYVVAMTAFAMDGDRERCLAAGADDYIPKPIDRGRLREVCGRIPARQ